MIKYKCPKCFRTAVLPNEMSYKFFICPGCRWQSQVFGPLASYDPADEQYGGKTDLRLSPFLPAGAPKPRKADQNTGHFLPMILGAKPQQDKSEPQRVQADQEMEEIPLMEVPVHTSTKPAGGGTGQPHKTQQAGKTVASQQHQAAGRPGEAKAPTPPPYQQPTRKYGPPAPTPPPPPRNAGRTGRPGQARYRSSYSQDKPLASGAIGAFIFALFSLIPCAGVIFGLIAMIAAGAIKKKILESSNAYSGMGLVKAAQVIGAIGFALSWIVLFSMLSH